MAGRIRSSLLCISLTVAFVIHAETARAVDSDTIILSSGGTPIFSFTLTEGGIESVGISAAGVFPGGPPPGFVPGISIILTEPAGEPTDPLDPPPFILPNQDIASDFLMADPVTQGLFFASDGDPNFAQFLNNAIVAGIPLVLIPETGGLQDVTQFLPGSPVQVQIQSDVVPEPGTLALLGSGLLGVAVRARRARS